MTDHMLVETANRVTTITFNRPDKKNAITQAMYQTMADTIKAYGEDDNANVLMITAEGEMFTAGNDLQDFAMGSRDTHELPPVAQFLLAIASCEKPLIAAVNGHAIGVGLTLTLHCDLVYAAKSASFSAPFVQLALVPEASSSLLLPNAVGMAVANDIIFAGRKLSADEAHQYGMVSRVFSDDTFADEVAAIAAQVAAQSPRSMKKSKALMRHNRDFVIQHMNRESKDFAEQLQHPDFMESVAAKMQKRAPNYG